MNRAEEKWPDPPTQPSREDQGLVKGLVILAAVLLQFRRSENG
jgi:hypothetical protein